MWTRSIARRQTFRALAAATCLAVAGFGLAGCTAAYVTDSTAPVLFTVVDINGGAAFKSDVRTGDSAVADDIITVAVANRAKSPNPITIPNIPMAVLVERYEVSYYRSDGRGVEGVDVPYRISGNITTTVDVAVSGTVDIPITVVRALAKLEPPLINLWGTETGVLGGTALEVTMFAKVTIHGHTIAGQAVGSTGNVQITFADYPE